MSRRGPLRRAFKRWRETTLDRLGWLYGTRFFAKSSRKKGDSDQLVAATLRQQFTFRSVIDLGCGDGYFLAALQAAGCEVLGLERSAAGLDGCGRRGVPARRFDIRADPLPDDARADLCLCFEVAEHLPAAYAARLVDLVTTAAPLAIFTAATPGQGGVGHFNEQPHAYWVALFEARGWRLDEAATERLRSAWRAAGVVSWLPDNVMVMERATP